MYLKEIKNIDFTPYFNGTPSFTTSVVNTSSTLQDKAVVSEIMGLRYSNIRKPSIEETNGLEVIGYYIVGAERTEFDKTILDSAVMFPTVVNNKYISHGLLQPETDKISRNVYAVLHPEHKFNQKEYVVFDKIIQEATKVPVLIANEPLDAVAIGTGEALKSIDVMRQG